MPCYKTVRCKFCLPCGGGGGRTGAVTLSHLAVLDSGPNDVNRISRDLNFSQKQGENEGELRVLFAACLRDVSETLNGPWKLGKEGHCARGQ